ncbi:MAG: putative lipid II flippase FtsW [Chloroflexota bacterium]|nr:putative lipid II flippase FtsW [Dehalococcoidia bacterium]MDW8253174.1 putative lipid II flippase FtsW [Chloroflexota bacterium]
MTRQRADYLLLGVVAILVMVGLQALYSASFALAMAEYNDPTYFIARQLIFAVPGAILMVVCWRIPFTFWRRLAFPIALSGIAALLLVLIPGVGVNVYGAQRWIQVGPLPAVQPSEFVKLALILYLAAWLADHPERIKRLGSGFIPFGLIVGAMVVPILLQPDLGTTVVIVATAIVLFYLAGAPSTFMIAIFGGIAALTPLLLAASYRSSRLEAFLDPWKDPLGNGFHIIQSLIAIGSGGLTGLGFGSSRQKFFYVFGSHSDAIFAIIAEELGFIGTVVVISLFVLFGIRGFRTAARCPDRFGALLAAGITTWLCLQAFINIGGITRTIPFTGIPLPFISYGGSALMATFCAVGILLNISRTASPPEPEEAAALPMPDAPPPPRVAGRPRHPAVER